MEYEMQIREALAQGVDVPVEHFLGALERMMGRVTELLQTPEASSLDEAEMIARRVEVLSRQDTSTPLTNTDADWLNMSQIFGEELSSEYASMVEVERRGVRARCLESLAFIARDQEQWEMARHCLEESIRLVTPKPQILLNMMSILVCCPHREKDVLLYSRQAIDMLEKTLQDMVEEMVPLFLHSNATKRLEYHERRTYTAMMLCVSQLHYATALEAIVKQMCAEHTALVSHAVARRVHCVTLVYADALQLSLNELGESHKVVENFKTKISEWSQWLCDSSPLAQEEEKCMNHTLRWKIQVKHAKHFEQLYNAGTLPSVSPCWLSFLLPSRECAVAHVQFVIHTYLTELAAAARQPSPGTERTLSVQEVSNPPSVGSRDSTSRTPTVSIIRMSPPPVEPVVVPTAKIAKGFTRPAKRQQQPAPPQQVLPTLSRQRTLSPRQTVQAIVPRSHPTHLSRKPSATPPPTQRQRSGGRVNTTTPRPEPTRWNAISARVPRSLMNCYT